MPRALVPVLGGQGVLQGVCCHIDVLWGGVDGPFWDSSFALSIRLDLAGFLETQATSLMA